MADPAGPQDAGRGGYDPRHYEVLVAAEDRHFWFEGRLRAIEAVVAPLVASWADGYRVLEIGCGTGQVLALLERVCAGGTVVGMDLLWDGLPYARRRTSCPLVRASSTSPPFRVRFDLIGLFDVVEHLDDDAGFLKRSRSLLTPRGALVITVPAHRALWSVVDERAHHCRRYDEEDLRALLTRCGYRIEFLSPFLGSLYPLMRLSRRLPGRRRSDDPLRDELRVVPGVNAALTWILRWEARRFLARRRRMPLGASLIAVARPLDVDDRRRGT